MVYASCQLKLQEMSYPTHDLELAAVVLALMSDPMFLDIFC